MVRLGMGMKARLALLVLASLTVTTMINNHLHLRQPTTVLHLIPHSHLDPGWKLTPEETFHTQAVPIFKRTLIELLLDTRRTTVFEPIMFVVRFLALSGDSPLSISSFVDGGFSNPLEMYVEAVTVGLASRASSLESGFKQSSPSGSAGGMADSSRLWRFATLPRSSFEAIASVIHDHENLPTDEALLNSISALLLQESLLYENVAPLFFYGFGQGKGEEINHPSHVSENALRYFLDDFNKELKRLKAFMRRGDGKARKFETMSVRRQNETETGSTTTQQTN